MSRRTAYAGGLIMGKLAARITALEKRHTPAATPWWEGRTIEDTQRSVAEALRRAQVKERTEALLTPSERLALRRQELEELDSRHPSNHPLRATVELSDRVCRGFLLNNIRDLERENAVSSGS